jgi:hypothetical protein
MPESLYGASAGGTSMAKGLDFACLSAGTRTRRVENCGEGGSAVLLFGMYDIIVRSGAVLPLSTTVGVSILFIF